MTAAEPLAQAAVLLNDASQVMWTNAVLLPCIIKAAEELEQELEINEIPIQKDESIDITVESGDLLLDELPTDFVEPISLFERTQDSTDSWNKVDEVEFIDRNLTDNPLSYVFQWAYRDNLIYINPPNTNREVQLNYVRSLTPIVASSTVLEISQSKNFLAARCAQIAAANLGQNPEKAAELQQDVDKSLDKLIRRMLKNKQGVGGARRKGWRSYRR